MNTQNLHYIVDLHFGDGGSQYARDLERRYPGIVKGIKEGGLRALPIESDELLRDLGDSGVVEYFVPQIIKESGQLTYVGHSSGTTRLRVPVPWLESTTETEIDWYEWNFSRYGIARNRNLFAYGPGGLFQDHMNRIAARMGGNAIIEVNDDLGKLKRAFDSPEKDKVAKEIVEKLVAPRLLSNLNIGTLVSLPPILEALDVRLVGDVDAIIIGGFGTTHDEYWQLRRKFRGHIFAECYGNIFWGWAFGDDSEGFRDFYPPPFLKFEIVKPDTSENLGYREYGQVVATRYTPELLVRWRERDAAMLIPPRAPFSRDGVRDVRPLSRI